MSTTDKGQTDAEDILSETPKLKKKTQVEISEPPKTETEIEPPKTETEIEPPKTEKELSPQRQLNIVFIGIKPVLTYVTATLTQLASEPTVTIKARGKRITQAVDVSQMIVKRMNAVGYKVSGVRIASDSLMSQDGKQRNVSSIEIDITK